MHTLNPTAQVYLDLFLFIYLRICFLNIKVCTLQSCSSSKRDIILHIILPNEIFSKHLLQCSLFFMIKNCIRYSRVKLVMQLETGCRNFDFLSSSITSLIDRSLWKCTENSKTVLKSTRFMCKARFSPSANCSFIVVASVGNVFTPPTNEACWVKRKVYN